MNLSRRNFFKAIGGLLPATVFPQQEQRAELPKEPEPIVINVQKMVLRPSSVDDLSGSSTSFSWGSSHMDEVCVVGLFDAPFSFDKLAESRADILRNNYKRLGVSTSKFDEWANSVEHKG